MRAAIIMQSLNDHPAWLRTEIGRKTYKNCIEFVRGTEWDDVFNSPVSKETEEILRQSEFAYTRMEETSRMIETNTIPNDAYSELRYKIAKIKIEISYTKDEEKRMDLIRDLAKTYDILIEASK